MALAMKMMLELFEREPQVSDQDRLSQRAKAAADEVRRD